MNILVKKSSNYVQKRAQVAFANSELCQISKQVGSKPYKNINMQFSQKNITLKANNGMKMNTQNLFNNTHSDLFVKNIASFETKIAAAGSQIKNQAQFMSNLNKRIAEQQSHATNISKIQQQIVQKNTSSTLSKTVESNAKNFNIMKNNTSNQNFVQKMKNLWMNQSTSLNMAKFGGFVSAQYAAYHTLIKDNAVFDSKFIANMNQSQALQYTQGDNKRKNDDDSDHDDHKYDDHDHDYNDNQHDEHDDEHHQNDLAQQQGDQNSQGYQGNFRRNNDMNQPPSFQRTEETERTLYVGNINFQTQEDTLMEHFTQFGEIEKIRIARGRNNLSKGFAHIVFKKIDDIEKLFNDQDIVVNIDGRALRFERARGFRSRYQPRSFSPQGGQGGFRPRYNNYRPGPPGQAPGGYNRFENQRYGSAPQNSDSNFRQSYDRFDNSKKICYVCGKMGHISRDCPQNSQQNQNQNYNQDQ